MASLTFPRTLAAENRKLAILVTRPANPAAPTVTELTAGIDASCRLAASDTRLSATDSETINDGAICEGASAKVLGSSNYEGRLAPFRIFDPEDLGRADTEGDKVFQTLKTKGVPVWVVERHTGLRHDVDWKAGQEVSVYEFTPDNWQNPSDQGAGWNKRVIPGTVNTAWLNAAVAGTTP